LDLVVKIDRSRWTEGVKDLGYETLDEKELPSLYYELEEEFFVTHITNMAHGLIGIQPWVCRGCGELSARRFLRSPSMRFEVNVHGKDAADKSPHAMTMTTPILIPTCEKEDCQLLCKKICEDFNRKHQHIDSCNHGIEDFSDFYSDFEGCYSHFGDFGGAPGQKPIMVYSIHINADLEGQDKIVKVPIFKLPPRAQGVVPFTADTWHSLSEEQKNAAIKEIEVWAEMIIVAKNFVDGTPLSCRECHKQPFNIYFAHRGRTVTHIPNESVFLTRSIAIPVCSGGVDSPCLLRAQQRAEHWMRSHEGDNEMERSKRRCSYCGTRESVTDRFLQCSRCKAHYFCKKECQVAHWRAGHKKACQPWDFPTNSS